MLEPFELSWTGAGATRYMRRRHPEVDEFSWGTIRVDDYPRDMVERARASWTEGAYSEYCTAAAFSHLVTYMLQANVPVDLVAMAGEFVADEMLHVELNARIAMELGGGMHPMVELESLIPELPGLSPIQKVNELMVRISCVGESFSVPVVTGTMRSASHPLIRQVLTRIVKDEAPHARLGWLYFDWIGESLDDTERSRLAVAAADGLRALSPYWQDRGEQLDCDTGTFNELGWMDSTTYGETARLAVRRRVVEPLAKLGIVIPDDEVTLLLS